MSKSPFMTLRSRRPHDGSSLSSADSTYGSGSDSVMPATHDTSRVNYHVKHLENFVSTLQESANRAFPNRGRHSQRYTNVQALLLHWQSDDLFVLPELEDLEKTLRDEYSYETEIFAIPSDNPHLELMLKVAELIKKHESEDTLFLVYYGGHAKIDESRQSTWCATRHPSAPWLQWSAIQTLLERSASDVLILLDCCAGAASATFPNGQSITETISASSWDAIAPDPGRYSFTNALIEVLQEWKVRTFSAAMLHAEVLARLKHPRPIQINGKHFEARSTPVHFMMTANHKAPSIEMSRIVPDSRRPATPPMDLPYQLPQIESAQGGGRSAGQEMSQPEIRSPLVPAVTDPTEDHPHVMISLALEDDQRLDLNAWEQWLANFPALAKHVKIQGLFQSHSTLLLLSLPVMVWDLLPDDPAYSFIAFVRSNNLLTIPSSDKGSVTVTQSVPTPVTRETVTSPQDDIARRTSAWSEDARTINTYRDSDSLDGTTIVPSEHRSSIATRQGSILRSALTRYQQQQEEQQGLQQQQQQGPARLTAGQWGQSGNQTAGSARSFVAESNLASHGLQRQQTAPPSLPGLGGPESGGEAIARTMILNQSRRFKRTLYTSEDVPEGPLLADHVVHRLEEYFHRDSEPNVAVSEFLASNLGVETDDIRRWFHHRREQERMTHNLQSLRMDDYIPEARQGTRMILPGQLNNLLDIFPSQGALVIDLRSSFEYDRSHIHGAVNIRAPLSFVEVATLEMVADTIVDNHLQRIFAKWSEARSVILYDRMIEHTFECPMADALLDKFKRKGWTGQIFILKGHFKEFSASFDKHIGGSRMTQESRSFVDDLRQQPTLSQRDLGLQKSQYDAWLSRFEAEDHVSRAEISAGQRAERMHMVEQHQRELEREFEARFPTLYKKAQALRPAAPSLTTPYGSDPPLKTPSSSQFRPSSGGKASDADSFDLKAGLVDHLDRGLGKMREAGGFGPSYAPPPSRGRKIAYTDKLGERVERHSDDFDEIDPKGEGLKNDPAFQLAGAGARQESAGEAVEDHRRKGRRPLWDRLRSSGNK